MKARRAMRPDVSDIIWRIFTFLTFVLIGISLIGLIALAIALAHPETAALTTQ